MGGTINELRRVVRRIETRESKRSLGKEEKLNPKDYNKGNPKGDNKTHN